MAYLREIDRRCSCGKRATVEVIGRGNASYGVFCGTCGNRQLKQIQRDETGAA